MFLKREEKLDISAYTWSDSFLEFEFYIISQDPTEIRNPSETLLVNLGPIFKKLSRNPKA